MSKEKLIMNYLDGHSKVIAVDSHSYTLDDGDVVEHNFELPDDITVAEFQKMLDDAKSIITNIINKVE